MRQPTGDGNEAIVEHLDHLAKDEQRHGMVG
jgi:hypothetical protein